MNYKDLTIWKKSYQLCIDVYKICNDLPKDEKFGLISQVQRSAVSIPSNIAEGQQRNSNKEFKHFLAIAKGSSAELETQLMLINDLYGCDVAKELAAIDEIQRMVQTLMNKL